MTCKLPACSRELPNKGELYNDIAGSGKYSLQPGVMNETRFAPFTMSAASRKCSLMGQRHSGNARRLTCPIHGWA